MVILLRFAGGDQSRVAVQDGLRKTGRTGGEVDGRIVLVRQFHRRGYTGAASDHLGVVVRKRRSIRVGTHEEVILDMQLVLHLGDTLGEFGAENNAGAVRQIRAVADFFGRAISNKGPRNNYLFNNPSTLTGNT